jgi:hypothetical protein
VTARSRQAARLAYKIEQRARLRGVECIWMGGGSHPTYSGWQLRWTDGPTADEMRTLVAELADHVPALDLGELRYSRSHTDLADAAALLRYLDTHSEQAVHVNTLTVEVAFASTSYPETSPEHWRQRARALLSLSRHNTLSSGEALQALTAHVRAHGWPATLSWLDAIADSRTDPDVIDFAARARERRT